MWLRCDDCGVQYKADSKHTCPLEKLIERQMELLGQDIAAYMEYRWNEQ